MIVHSDTLQQSLAVASLDLGVSFVEARYFSHAIIKCRFDPLTETNVRGINETVKLVFDSVAGDDFDLDLATVPFKGSDTVVIRFPDLFCFVSGDGLRLICTNINKIGTVYGTLVTVSDTTSADTAFTWGDPLNISVTNVSTAVLAANANRRGALIVNDSASVVYLGIGVPAVFNRGIRLNASGGVYEMNSANLSLQSINAISNVALGVNVGYMEAV